MVRTREDPVVGEAVVTEQEAEQQEVGGVDKEEEEVVVDEVGVVGEHNDKRMNVVWIFAITPTANGHQLHSVTKLRDCCVRPRALSVEEGKEDRDLQGWRDEVHPGYREQNNGSRGLISPSLRLDLRVRLDVVAAKAVG